MADSGIAHGDAADTHKLADKDSITAARRERIMVTLDRCDIRANIVQSLKGVLALHNDSVNISLPSAEQPFVRALRSRPLQHGMKRLKELNTRDALETAIALSSKSEGSAEAWSEWLASTHLVAATVDCDLSTVQSILGSSWIFTLPTGQRQRLGLQPQKRKESYS